jgi:hypothetical protein
MALGYIDVFDDNDDYDGKGDDSDNDYSSCYRTDNSLVLYVPS